MVDASAPEGYDGLQDFVRQSLVTGTAVILPLVVTLIVLDVVVTFVSRQLDPLVGVISATVLPGSVSDAVLKVVAVVALVLVIATVGAIAEWRPSGFGVSGTVESVIARIPGVGSLYEGVDEMSHMLLQDDTDSFQDVKLVEFPSEGSFSLAFLTAETPDALAEAVDREDMITLFMPLAPNPVMGGYVLHVDEDRVYDVDLTVEEGIQSIVTSGVATSPTAETELSADMLDRVDWRMGSLSLTDRVEEIEEMAIEASARLEERATDSISSGAGRADSGSDRDGSESDREDSAPDREGYESDRKDSA